MGESALRAAASRARRWGAPLRLLHVAEVDEPVEVEAAQVRLASALADAQAHLGARMRAEPVLVVGGLLASLASQAEGAALVVLERPAVVRLRGLEGRTSLTTTLVEHLEVSSLVVPGLWPISRAYSDSLPASWHDRYDPRTVAVLLDDPAECREVVNAGLTAAADIGGSVELVRGWESDRAAVVAVSRSANLMIVGRGGSVGGLSTAGRVALHESVCPVLMVDVAAPVEPLAEVIPFRRRA